MPEIEELQFQIYHLKKENSNLRNENQLHKVKVRKLTDELNKVNKQLDVILDPKKNNNITRILSRHGAHLITKLKEENLSLYKKLAEKDLQVKKLQSDLEMTRLYVQEKARIVSPSLKLLEHQEIINKVGGKEEYAKTPMVSMKPKTRSRSYNREKSRSRSLSVNKKESTTTQLEKSYMELLNNNLQKIKQSGSFLQDKMNHDISNSTMIKYDTPHEEIQQLQGYLLNVLNEVDSLKNTIGELQREQVKTSDILNDKNFYKSLQTKVQQLKSHANILEDLEDETELSDTRSADKVSSKSSGTSAESDENESASEPKVTPVQSQNIDPVSLGLKSVSIQTTRSFCSRMFTPITKAETENPGKSSGTADLDECDLEAEYI